MDNVLKAKYHFVFDSPQGRDVLAHILQQLYFFHPAENVIQQARRDYATELLAMLGVFRFDMTGNMDEQNQRDVVDGLLHAYKPTTEELEQELDES